MSFRAVNLVVSVHNRRLLDAVSVALKPGVLTIVIGPNGSGKTTLLNALTGDRDLDSGDITLNDQKLADWKPQQLARMRGVLPQRESLDFPFRAEQVVLMGRSPWRETAGESCKIVRQVMQFMDAAHLAHRLYTTLSGGERQRVQLARVLAQIWRPGEFAERYLLLDEPIAALDLRHQYSLLDGLKRKTREDSIGALVTLHDLNLAAQFADELVLLDKGRVAATGSAQAVLTESLIESVYDIPVRVDPHPVYSGTPMVTPLFRESGPGFAV